MILFFYFLNLFLMILNITSIGLLLGLPRKLIYSFSWESPQERKYLYFFSRAPENEFIHFLGSPNNNPIEVIFSIIKNKFKK